MRIKKANLINWSLVTSFFLILFSGSVSGDDDAYYRRLKKGWLYMRQVYDQLNQHYVEEVDPYPLIRAGIDGMLDNLDPYTVFLEDDGERQLRIITTGKYGGLGLEIGLRDKKVTVIAPIEDSPAQKMGMQAGDIIKAIDGQSIANWNISKVSGHLRGDIGTKVTLSILRPGLDNTFDITLTREMIVVKDVSYAGFISPGIAYISLTGFTEKAAEEMKRAINDLQDEGQIEAMVLDLRGNPGGLLSSSVEIVNIFVPKGELVVYTKGYREKETKFYTKDTPLMENVPLAVVVDEGSASAAEIVAGALQDLDRAVIIGEPTFGKGLVQKVYPIDDNEEARIKITTAKYFVPSGRCIQRQDYSIDNELVRRDTSMSKKESELYYTRNKRTVYDKGGIYPDVYIKGDSINYMLADMIRSNLFFDFAVRFHQEHPEWKMEYENNNGLMDDFEAYINEKKYTLRSSFDDEVEDLENQIADLKENKQITLALNQLKAELNKSEQIEYEKSKSQMKKILLLELAEKYKGRAFRHELAMKSDSQLNEALKILTDIPHYNEVLAIR